jgi:DNA (cytosine-5)-methyltransferase 1
MGFQRAGFKTIAAYDNWLPAADTYRLNFGHHVLATAVDNHLDTPTCDVIAGGPPCQGFSSAGRRQPCDHRNSLVGVFARLIAKAKPRAFVFENVEGFLTGHDGRYVFELLEPLIKTGYRIHLRKINAAHYGVPQHRKRVIAIGGLGWSPTFATTTHSAFGAPGAHLGNGSHAHAAATLGQALTSLPPACPNGNEPALADHDYTPLDTEDLLRAQLLKPGQRMRDLPEHLWHDSFRKRAFRRVMDGTPSEKRGGAPSGIRRLNADEPSKAITGGSLRDFLHPYEDRPLTIRECAAIQTFPDDFQLAGTRRERIQLIGNAVPPLLAHRIAERLALDLRRNPTPRREGCLLSFIPTLSSGMSPVLSKVREAVGQRYGTADNYNYAGSLWH